MSVFLCTHIFLYKGVYIVTRNFRASHEHQCALLPIVNIYINLFFFFISAVTCDILLLT